MSQYIDKSALVTEIKRLSQKAIELYGYSQFNTAYNNVLESIDALEVKEVDLNLEITLWLNAIPEIRLDDVERLAKYFFELGLKAQKGE